MHFFGGLFHTSASPLFASHFSVFDVFPSSVTFLFLFFPLHRVSSAPTFSAGSFLSLPHPLSFPLFCLTIPSFLTLLLLQHCDTVVMVTPIIFWHEWRIPY